MLSTIEDSSDGGIVSRIFFSTSANIAEAVSMRVPTGGRTCRVICPESTEGKKLEPRNGARPNEATTTTRKPITNRRRCSSAMASRLR